MTETEFLRHTAGGNPVEAGSPGHLLIPWINAPLMSRAAEIENAVMIVHGEKAHSFYFGSDAYKRLTVVPGKPSNKLFTVVPGASHTDLYDRKDIIPFDAIQRFFDEYLR